MFCRYCFEEEEINKNINNWLTPCKCSGTTKYVH